MQSSDSLFVLVKSLTPSEKRYFKVFADRHSKGDGNKYLLLFEAIARQKSYNESKLLKKLGYGKNPNRLAVAKNYLYQLILRSLRDYHANKTVEAELSEMLQYIKILFDRRLLKESRKLLHKAAKLAEDAERFDYLLMIRNWERRFVSLGFHEEGYTTAIIDIRQKLKSIYQILQLENDYINLYADVLVAAKQKGMIRSSEGSDKLKEMLQSPLLNSIDTATTLKAKVFYYSVYAEYYSANQDYEKLYEYVKKRLSLYLDHPKFAEAYQTNYMVVLSAVALVELELKKFNDLNVTLTTLRKFKPKRSELNTQKEALLTYLQVANVVQSGHIKKGEDLLKAIDTYFKKLKGQVPRRRDIELMFNAALIHYSLQHYDMSLNWLDKLQKTVDKDLFIHNISMCRLLTLVIYYELEKWTLLESHTKSLERFLQKRKEKYELEIILIRFFKKIPYYPSRGTKRNAFIVLKSELVKIRQERYQQKMFDLFDFVVWIDSVLQEKNYADLLKTLSSDSTYEH